MREVGTYHYRYTGQKNSEWINLVIALLDDKTPNPMNGRQRRMLKKLGLMSRSALTAQLSRMGRY